MTRLTETDVTTLTRDLEAFEARLREATGLDLRDLALRTVTDGDRCVQLHGARIAAVPMSTGEGVIPGFCACVVATLLHLGCDAWMTTQPDVRGIQAAVAGGATRPLPRRRPPLHRAQPAPRAAASTTTRRPRTATSRRSRRPQAGSTAVTCCCSASARSAGPRRAGWRLAAPTSLVVEPDAERIAGGAATSASTFATSRTWPMALRRCDLIFDASPAADIIDAGDLSPETIAAVPGMPSAFTPAAQEALGARHIHEPLAIGVAVMAARALL